MHAVFTPLFMGASIYIPDAEDIHNPGQLAAWMARHGITVSHLTPGMLRHPGCNRVGGRSPGLRWRHSGGRVITNQ
jgi:non-ribosomal peptide synthetase component F